MQGVVPLAVCPGDRVPIPASALLLPDAISTLKKHWPRRKSLDVEIVEQINDLGLVAGAARNELPKLMI
jgi:hypothetical protein